MSKCKTIAAIVVISIALIAAEPPFFRQTRRFGALRERNQHQLARQEAAATAAPYPAAGVTPEIPFNLPNEPDQKYGPPESTPDQSYGPPDQTYGPPGDSPDQTYGPPSDAAADPDTTYGPPAGDQPATESAAPTDDADEVPVDAELVSLNLIQPRRKNGPSRIRLAPLRFRTAQPRGQLVEIIRSEPIFVYTLQ